MKRRICAVVAAIGVSALSFGAAAAAAAGGPVTTVKCATKVGIMVAAGESSITPVVPKGAEYGAALCGKQFGQGVQADLFKVPDSGDVLAAYQLYFHNGTLSGKYVLTPQLGQFGADTFAETDYIGRLTVTGGTGAFAGAEGTGTMKCKSVDGIHTACVDKLKLTQL